MLDIHFDRCIWLGWIPVLLLQHIASFRCAYFSRSICSVCHKNLPSYLLWDAVQHMKLYGQELWCNGGPLWLMFYVVLGLYSLLVFVFVCG